MIYTTHLPEDNNKIAEEFLSKIEPDNYSATIVGLYGNLGSGKTTFTKSIAKALGVGDTITSPTFVIEKVYELYNKKFKHLIHIDAYRLDNEDELMNLGWSEIIKDPENLILVEWPEKIQGTIPKHIKINFRPLLDQDSRQISIEY